MDKKLVYDLPTRIFHFLFAIMFFATFFIAKTFDDDSAVYPFHMLLGLCLAFIVLLRIVWGVIGSRYAKFNSFRLKPSELLSYLRQMLYSKSKSYTGHNPASSWIAIIMMLLALGLALTGYLMTEKIYKEVFEEVHEVLANAFLVAVILHISGIIFHSLRHKDAIGLSMWNGKKEIDIPKKDELNHSYPLAAVVFLGFFLGFFLYLGKSYDTKRQSLTILNKTYQLGESENNESLEEINERDNE